VQCAHHGRARLQLLQFGRTRLDDRLLRHRFGHRRVLELRQHLAGLQHGHHVARVGAQALHDALGGRSLQASAAERRLHFGEPQLDLFAQHGGALLPVVARVVLVDQRVAHVDLAYELGDAVRGE
jgi:hypothetical protein